MTTISGLVKYASAGAMVIGAIVGVGMTATPAQAVACVGGGVLAANLAIVCPDYTINTFTLSGNSTGGAYPTVNAQEIGAGRNSFVLLTYGAFLVTHDSDISFQYKIVDTAGPFTSFSQQLTAAAGTGILFQETVYKNGFPGFPGSTQVGSITNTNSNYMSMLLPPGIDTLYVVKDWAVASNPPYVACGAVQCTGVVSSVVQDFHQEVPEIDAASSAGAIGLLLGAMALAGERRRRRRA